MGRDYLGGGGPGDGIGARRSRARRLAAGLGGASLTPPQVSEGSEGVEGEDEVGWVGEARSVPPEQAWARPHWDAGEPWPGTRSPHPCLPVS